MKGRSSRRGCSVKNVLLKNPLNAQETHMLEPLFNKVAGFKSVTLSKKRLRHRCFLFIFAKFFRNFLQNTSGRLLLLERYWILLQMTSIATAKNICKANYQKGFMFSRQLWADLWLFSWTLLIKIFLVLEFYLSFELAENNFLQVNL